MKSKKVLIVIVAALCFAIAGALAGCGSETVSGSSSSSSDSASANRSYMSSANTIIEELQDNLNDFSDAVAEDDLVSMKAAMKKADKSIAKFEKLQPPDDLKSVHEEYTKGCDELKEALSEYVDLYSDQQKSKLSDSEYSKRLKSIQKKYNSGIKHLKAGDEKVTSL